MHKSSMLHYIILAHTTNNQLSDVDYYSRHPIGFMTTVDGIFGYRINMNACTTIIFGSIK